MTTLREALDAHHLTSSDLESLRHVLAVFRAAPVQAGGYKGWPSYWTAIANDLLSVIDAALAVPLPEHPEDTCERCGGSNLRTWHAPSPLWNAVMRHADGHDTFGIVCPQCFAALALERGIDPIWHLEAHGVDLPQSNVDGRVWDPAQCLWVDP